MANYKIEVFSASWLKPLLANNTPVAPGKTRLGSARD